MTKFTMKMLKDFIEKAKVQTQSEILKSFLRLIIFRGDLSESGSILVWNRLDQKLHLFNDDEFLFKEKFLDPNKQWKLEFDRWEGLAGYAFETGKTEYSDDVMNDSRFAPFGGDAIKTMVCVPIVIRSLPQPFGVASFHSGPSAAPLDEEARTTSEVAVNTLGLALELSAARLATQSVFIVHGRDKSALDALRVLLQSRGINPVTLGDQARTGEALLQKLEEIMANCCAGFVLLTPDDVGRLKSDKKGGLRARQNVLFEGGLLYRRFGPSRVSFLVTDPKLEIPSDLKEVLYLDFNPKDPNEGRIEEILKKWGVKLTRRDL